jgi:quercetin dioxygenase-like cupin family protein
MHISRASRSGAPTQQGPKDKFTNSVYIDPILSADGISSGNVNFTPGARTHWHTHEGGQLLHVLAGSGWVCDQGSEPVRINVGDVIWCPPGTTHWHGADDNSYLVHKAVSLGSVKWLEPVGDEEYGKKGKS